jgi:amino acid transporter
MGQANDASTGPGTTAAQPSVGGGRFGAFSGVFTPSILTILGVIMYLRFGWVVGNAGLGQALMIVAVAHLITLATGFSVSSIATNRTVGAGGAYYIISRSLGAPAGAAIGIPLFLGQALSITFYIVGFTESLRPLVPGLPEEVIGSVLCLLVGFVTYKSADLAIKAQYVVMGLIGLSLISFFAGTGPAETQPDTVIWWNDDGEGFAIVFAVFFPAVTGIMAGVGMSGDLRDPRRDLPLGTLLAVAVGFVVYMIFPVWLAYNVDLDTMIDDPNVVWTVAAVPALIYVGVWGATLSSALGSFLTAPRTLQALAFDNLAPRVFASGSGPASEPRAGIIFTLVLAEIGVLLGNLDAIANLLTMFFLATYGFTNLACGLERWAASPSFRPTFRVPWWVSIAGGLACFYVMSIIDLVSMIVAFVVCGLIYAFVQRRTLTATWGDARHGIWSALVRTSLHRLKRTEFHPSNWRPNLLILGGGVEKRLHLLELGSAIVQDRGIVTYMHLLRGAVDDKSAERISLNKSLEEALADRYPNVFSRVDIVDDLYRGVVSVAQSYGVGSFEANTVMLGWSKKEQLRRDYVTMLGDLARLDRSLVLVNFNLERRFGTADKIQIWWGGLQQNGGLMLLLAFLLTAHHRWRKAAVEVVTVVPTEPERQAAVAAIEAVLASAHLTATPKVLLREGRSIHEIMRTESQGVDLAIVGMRLPKVDEADAFFERMNAMLETLPTTLLVHSSRDFQGEPVLFDSPDGEAREIKVEPEAPAIKSGDTAPGLPAVEEEQDAPVPVRTGDTAPSPDAEQPAEEVPIRSGDTSPGLPIVE